MKKLFFLLILVAGAEGTRAQSMLKVRLKDNTTQLSIALDNRFFNKKGTSITVGDLPYGRHNLKIYSITYNKRGRPREEIIYDGDVKTYNGMISTFIFDPETGGGSLQDMDINAYTANHPVPPQGQPVQNNGYDDQGNNGQQRYGLRNNEQQNNDNAAGDDNTQSGPAASPMASGSLTAERIAALKAKVADKKTDTQKLALLKDELKNEKVTTIEIADMMDWFAFEASKVEFAKWVYSITVDKEYFTDLEQKFTYKNSQEDLDKFIKNTQSSR